MAWVDFFVCLYFGSFGVHKFRERRVGIGILYFFTMGLFGMGWIVDIFRYLIAAIEGKRIVANQASKKNTKDNIDEYQYEGVFCSKCNHYLFANENFCPKCGTAKYANKEEPVYRSIWFWVVVVFTVVIVIGVSEKTKSEGSSLHETENIVTESTLAIESESVTMQWKENLPSELIEDIEIAFVEIGENPDYIESVEIVDTTETAFFYNRDYKVTFDKGSFFDMLDPETWVHSRFYRITTQEWFDSEPEKDIYPYEYLTAIKFWTDDDTTNINQWAQNGTGKLQDPDTTVLPEAQRDNVVAAYSISVSELVAEINKDKAAAGEKYNGQWIEITGTVTYISKGAGMTGYYLWGERGGSGLNITCWVDEADDTGLSVGDTVTFIGAMREVSTFNNTEIGLCVIKQRVK